MKILASIVMFVLLSVYANAQQDAKVIAEIAASSERTIKNAPFSAEAVSESVQVLADGNRIVRSSTSKMYRNSEGRFRREIGGGAGGVLGSVYTLGSGVSILDPVAGQRYLLDSLGKTARILELNRGQVVSIAGNLALAERKELTDAQRAELEKKIAAAKNLTEKDRELAEAKVAEAQKIVSELKARTPVVNLAGQDPIVYDAGTIVGVGGGTAVITGGHAKYETKTEELGTRDFEGVSAEGTRKTTTIPAGAIGNERPIEITYERWYSKELELVVYSKHSDPRFGDQTYRLTNIVRSEPDPSLFTVPTGYRVLAEPASVYRLNTTLKASTIARPVTTTSVKNTKP